MQQVVEAKLPQGLVIGVQESGVCRFSAIPFADPPIGALRFKPPVPAQWQGTLDAIRIGSAAPNVRHGCRRP